MSYFIKSKTGNYSVRYKTNGMVISHNCDTKKASEAKEIKAYWDMEYKLGRWNPFFQKPPHQTLVINQIDIWFDNFIKEKQKKKVKPKSLNLYKTSIQSYVNFTKHRTIEEITHSSIDDWIESTKMAYSTKKNYLGHISYFLSFCVKRGLIYENPAKSVEIVKDREPVRDWLTVPEYEKFIEGLKAYKHADYSKHGSHLSLNPIFIKMVEFITNSGCRISEVCDLKESAIRPEFIVVFGKGDKERKIPLHDNLKKIVEETILIKRQLRINSQYLFSFRNDRVNSHYFTKLFRKYADNLGVRKTIHVHSLRRTCATWLRLNGVPVDIIKEILGHSEIKTTEIYLNIQNAVVSDAMNKAFNQILNKSIKQAN